MDQHMAFQEGVEVLHEGTRAECAACYVPEVIEPDVPRTHTRRERTAVPVVTE